MSARNDTRGAVARTSTTRVLALVASAGAAAAVLAGCTPDEHAATVPGTTPPVVTGDQVDPGALVNVKADHPAELESASVTLKDASGAEVGSASFEAKDDAVSVDLHVSGMEPGSHGVHVHENGTCEPDTGFASAGGHLQVDGHTGKPESGDLTSVNVLKDGTGSISSVTDTVTVDQVRGKALIVHDVSGDERIACGIIADR